MTSLVNPKVFRPIRSLVSTNLTNTTPFPSYFPLFYSKDPTRTIGARPTFSAKRQYDQLQLSTQRRTKTRCHNHTLHRKAEPGEIDQFFSLTARVCEQSEKKMRAICLGIYLASLELLDKWLPKNVPPLFTRIKRLILILVVNNAVELRRVE